MTDTVDIDNKYVKNLGVKAKRNHSHLKVECEKDNCVYYKNSVKNYANDINYVAKNNKTMNEICPNTYQLCCDVESKKTKTNWGHPVKIKYMGDRMITCICENNRKICKRCWGFRQMNLYDYCKLNMSKKELLDMHKDKPQVIHTNKTKDCSPNVCVPDYKAFSPFGTMDNTIERPFVADNNDEMIEMTYEQKIDMKKAEIDNLKKQYIASNLEKERVLLNNKINQEEIILQKMIAKHTSKLNLDTNIQDLEKEILSLENEIVELQDKIQNTNLPNNEMQELIARRKRKESERDFKNNQLNNLMDDKIRIENAIAEEEVKPITMVDEPVIINNQTDDKSNNDSGMLLFISSSISSCTFLIIVALLIYLLMR